MLIEYNIDTSDFTEEVFCNFINYSDKTSIHIIQHRSGLHHLLLNGMLCSLVLC